MWTVILLHVMVISGHCYVAAGDSILHDHLAKTPRNAMYTSPDIQNQILDIHGDHIRQKILLKVRQAQLFTVIADEVTDYSCT